MVVLSELNFNSACIEIEGGFFCCVVCVYVEVIVRSIKNQLIARDVCIAVERSVLCDPVCKPGVLFRRSV